MRGSPADRLAARTVRTDRCWYFTGCNQGRGYGSIWTDHGMVLVHRLAYELAAGPIADGMTIDHTCETKRCVRPDHLQVVTRAQNTALRWTRAKAAAA